ncbi:hypothetical protein [Leuconostoc carnosum]|uniref:hypothetical protein n=1 Tax=Leuconostoc carnosum TaxID=1252 RepID=UPI001238A92F|nr:hypothetical protein [Leuconostoc carnosum]KAA8368006.1 hypothetical protein FE416_02825 [Leuconostoc carnosum]
MLNIEQNKLQHVKNRRDIYSFFLFYVIILIQTILFTSFGRVFPSAAMMLGKLEMLMILLYVTYSLFIRVTIRKIVYVVVVMTIIVISAHYSGNSSSFIKLLLLTVAVPVTIPSAKKIVTVFGLAMSTTMVLTIILSLIGYLPRSGTATKVLFSNYQETVFFLGFNHPNAFGTFLTTIFMILSFLFYQKHKLKIIISGPVFLIINLLIGADTAAAGIFLLLIIYIVPLKLTKIYKLTYALPTILTCLSLWLAYNNTSNLGMIVNEKISSRPDVWHTYVIQYPINLFNHLPTVNTNGYFSILGNGVLDGSYIYILIYWGIVSWLVYNFIFITIAKFGIDNKNVALYGIALLTMFTAFPESHMIMFYENVFLIFVGFYQYSRDERKICLNR